MHRFQAAVSHGEQFGGLGGTLDSCILRHFDVREPVQFVAQQQRLGVLTLGGCGLGIRDPCGDDVLIFDDGDSYRLAVAETAIWACRSSAMMKSFRPQADVASKQRCLNFPSACG